MNLYLYSHLCGDSVFVMYGKLGLILFSPPRIWLLAMWWLITERPVRLLTLVCCVRSPKTTPSTRPRLSYLGQYDGWLLRAWTTESSLRPLTCGALVCCCGRCTTPTSCLMLSSTVSRFSPKFSLVIVSPFLQTTHPLLLESWRPVGRESPKRDQAFCWYHKPCLQAR